MSRNIHGKRHPAFDERLVQFWSSSYEALLDDYSRTELALRIHQAISLPAISSGPQNGLVLKFVLDRTGGLLSWNIIQESGDTWFDECLESAFMLASRNFSTLPEKSATETEFQLCADAVEVVVEPVLIHGGEIEFSFEVQHALRRLLTQDGSANCRVKAKVMLIWQRGKVVVEPVSNIVDSVELLNRMKENLSHLQQPLHFPDEIRFLVWLEHGACAVTEYHRNLRGLIHDELDRKNVLWRKRFTETEYEGKLEGIERLRMNDPDNLGLIDEALHAAANANKLEKTLFFCSEYARISGRVSEAHSREMAALYHHALYNDSVSQNGDRILEVAYAVLEERPEDLSPWLFICSVLAEVGKYDEAVRYGQLLEAKADQFDNSQLHGMMARALERIGSWKHAIQEWELALRGAPDGLGDECVQCINDCKQMLVQDQGHRTHPD